MLRDRIRPFIPRKIRKWRHAVYVAKNATYNADGMMTVHDADFMHDPLFQEAYRVGKETGSWGLSELPWRTYIACWAGRHALELVGDFVECGVNRGGISRAVMHYINFQSNTGRRFFLLDTFCGFPPELSHLATTANLHDYDECYEQVCETFRDFSNVSIIRGAIPATLPQVDCEKIAWLHLDMNVAEPEVAAADFFWDRLVPGAVVLLDDYGFGKPYWRQKEAMDKFAASRSTRVLLLPTGQGMMIKS